MTIYTYLYKYHKLKGMEPAVEIQSSYSIPHDVLDGSIFIRI